MEVGLIKSIFACTCLLITNVACGDTSTDGSSTGGNGSQNLSPPDAALISRADTSETVTAVRNGLNPETTLISSRFFCYDQFHVDFQQPNFLDVDGSSITITNGTESLPATIQPGPADGEVTLIEDAVAVFALDIEFNEYGQVLTASESSATLEGCYQDGAAHDAALHRFLLNTPDSGDFQCTLNGSDTMVSIELLSANQYRFADQSGAFRTQGIATDDFSNVQFLNGPLQNIEAEYYEDPKTGTQTLALDQRTSQTFTAGSAIFSTADLALCQHQSAPKPFKLFGPQGAPPAANPEVPLSGLYFLDLSSLTAETRSDAANYVEFKPSGYLYPDLPLSGGTNCALTKPNGLPLCEQYEFDGRTLSLVRPWGQIEASQVVTNSNGTLQSLDGLELERVDSVGDESIVGTWVSQEVDSLGVAACAVGVCSSSITDRAFHFRADGRFLFTFSSDSGSSFDTGVIATFSNSTSNNEGTGNYTLSGTNIALTLKSGQVEELPVHLTRRGNLAIGLIQYSRP